MNEFPRSTLATLLPSVHGALNYGELASLGLDPDSVIDFSAANNPYGPNEAVLQAVSSAVTASTLAQYPDRDCLAFLEALSVAESVPSDYLLPTNGASELIQLIALAFVTPGSRHLTLSPTFGEYSRAIHLMGGLIHEYQPDGPNFRFDIEAMAAVIRELRPTSVWLCNPNNPTGQYWTIEELAYLRAADPANEVLWIIDEAYRYFAKENRQRPAVDPAASVEQILNNQWSKNTIIVRSLTKEHGLAGLRLGHAIAAPDLIETLRVVQVPWSVNSLAQVAGVAALQPEVVAWRNESLAQLHRHAADLWTNLAALDFTVLPTSTPYALVEVGEAAQFRRALLSHGLLVRDCTSFGLPQYIRIAAQLPEDNQRLLNDLKFVIG